MSARALRSCRCRSAGPGGEGRDEGWEVGWEVVINDFMCMFKGVAYLDIDVATADRKAKLILTEDRNVFSSIPNNSWLTS